MDILKSPAGFELLTYKFGVNALTHCASLESDNFGKNIYKITLDFIVNSINSVNMGVSHTTSKRKFHMKLYDGSSL